MLDKDLCSKLKIDVFTQTLMAEADRLEEELHSSNLSPCRYIEVKAAYIQTLKLRDEYAAYLSSRSKHK